MSKAGKIMSIMVSFCMLSVLCLSLYGCDKQTILPTDNFLSENTQTDERQEDTLSAISFSLDPKNIKKVVCCNAYFPKERDVVVTDESEIEFLAKQLAVLTFNRVQEESEEDSEEDSDPGNQMTGGYAQFLGFYDENDQVLESIELKNNTELILTQEGCEYICIISENSELSQRIEELVDSYWE